VRRLSGNNEGVFKSFNGSTCNGPCAGVRGDGTYEAAIDVAMPLLLLGGALNVLMGVGEGARGDGTNF